MAGKRGVGFGFGFVVLIVVLAIVLLLVARDLESVAPVVDQIAGERPETAEPQELRRPEDLGGLGELPDLEQVRELADDHAAEVQAALEASE